MLNTTIDELSHTQSESIGSLEALLARLTPANLFPIFLCYLDLKMTIDI